MEDTILDIIDLLDSASINDIKRGLDQLDLLLAQLLPQIINYRKNPQTSKVTRLVKFISLQDSFQYNIVGHLINYYKQTWRSLEDSNNEYTLTCNRLLQGLLLLHSNSRKLFNRSMNMRLMLHFLEIPNESEGFSFPVEVTISFITTLIHILLKNFKNFRNFEDNNGCSVIIRKFKLPSSFGPPLVSRSNRDLNQQDLNFKIIEFLIFYLIDEKNEENVYADGLISKSIQEKSDLFRQDFPEIDNLVENLNDLKNL